MTAAFVQRSVEAIAAEIVAECRRAMESSNWEVGRLAVDWLRKTEKTDAEFGANIGLSKKQVQQRRSVWESFGHWDAEIREQLTWTHFRVAVSWDDATECLEWAIEAEASVQEMAAWRSAKNGTQTSAMELRQLELDVVEDENVGSPAEPLVLGSVVSGDDVGSRSELKKTRASKPRENVKQPRNVDPSKFDVFDELDHVVSTCRDLAAPFVAARRLDEYINGVRGHLQEMEDVRRKLLAEEEN